MSRKAKEYDMENAVARAKSMILAGKGGDQIKKTLFTELGVPYTSLGGTAVLAEAKKQIREEYLHYEDIARECQFLKIMEIWENTTSDSTRLKCLDQLSKLFALDTQKIEITQKEYHLDIE